jgi:hypothetical protein
MPLSRGEILALPDMLWQQFEFHPSDALVAMVPAGQESDAWLMAVMEQNNQARIYPVEGGHLYKFPYQGGEEFDPDLFKIERDAWDHEHCDVCQERISAGDRFWASSEEPYALLCTRCSTELLAFGKPWWKFW